MASRHVTFAPPTYASIDAYYAPGRSNIVQPKRPPPANPVPPMVRLANAWKAYGEYYKAAYTEQNQQMTTTNQQLTTTNQQLTDTNQQMTTTNQQLQQQIQQLQQQNQHLTTMNQQLQQQNQHLTTTNQQLQQQNHQQIAAAMKMHDCETKALCELHDKELSETAAKTYGKWSKHWARKATLWQKESDRLSAQLEKMAKSFDRCGPASSCAPRAPGAVYRGR
jgi:TolA-binding protein